MDSKARLIKNRFGGDRYKVDPKTGCWNWLGAKNEKGYGHVTVKGKSFRAHRFFYQQHNGEIPRGKQLSHLCDNESCVNPEHLEVSTALKNNRRRRWIKLTLKKANEIRRLYASGKYLQRELGVRFGVTRMTISDITNNRSWN